ncbi:hypothetical protein AA0535_1730 [Asaia krungthepensis NRIC 0535]|uniref:Helix-turn-helix domain-containing protein n=2 Tax=Asaia TaxID=91914 RepID=A0ABX2P317_9PROT|nr:hypothetical protein AA0535_1730 [Asaia krungthepensis NRIC 0535]GBR18673.1 hypothetical protein AA105894_2131 [Asaia spathodeae NBRC 105894]
MKDEVLIEMMRYRGMNARIARACGLSTAAVSQWKRIPRKHLEKVSDLSGVPPETLRPDLFNSVAQRNAA